MNLSLHHTSHTALTLIRPDSHHLSHTNQGMNMDERMTICNMVVEAGGKNGVIAPDQTTFDYVNARTGEAYEPVYTDGNATFCADYK